MDWVALLSNVGYPVVVSAYLAWLLNRQRETISQLSDNVKELASGVRSIEELLKK